MDTPVPSKPVTNTPWFTKFVECFFAGVIVINGLFIFLQVLPRSVLLKMGGLFVSLLFLGQFMLGFAAGLGFSFPWHKQERTGRIDSEKWNARLRGLLRYWLAFEIATYGFAKIMKTQFAESFIRDNTPVGQLNGFELTWNYFGHSYMLAIIIGSLQIGGSILLLFRRTTLFGVVILLPVLINIFLIDLFYHIPAGAFLNSILFTLGLFYLLMLRWPELIGVFWAPVAGPAAKRPDDFKNLLRLLAIGLPFGLLFGAVRRSPVSPLAGKWNVEQLIRNRDTVKKAAWLNDSTAWTTVYIEERAMLVFCPNPYVYEPQRSEKTEYRYDSVRHELVLVLRANRKDTVRFRVSGYDGKKMRWDGMFTDDTAAMELSRPYSPQ
jgi:hypothetical protein